MDLARHKGLFIVKNHRIAAAAQTDVHRSGNFGCRLCRLTGLTGIGRHQNGYIGNAAHNGQIFKKLMAHPFAFAGRQTAVDPHHLHIQVGIGNKSTDLLTGPHGDKARISGKIGNQPAQGQTGRYTGRILLRYAQLHHPVGKFLQKRVCTHSLEAVGTNQHYSVVFFCQSLQALHKTHTGTRYIIQDLLLPKLIKPIDVLRR